MPNYVDDVQSIVINNQTYKNKDWINTVDLMNVPWKDNSLANAFYDCENLTMVMNINSNVTNMSRAFRYCQNLHSSVQMNGEIIDLTIPESVTDMSETFAYCSGQKLDGLKDLPESVTNMHSTFEGCLGLQNMPNIPNNVTDLAACFYECNQLENTSPITESVTRMGEAFYNCQRLTTGPDMSNATSVEDMYETFGQCYGLITAPDMSNATSVENMEKTFKGCDNLRGDIYIGSPNVYTIYECFSGSYDKNVHIPFVYQNGDFTTTYETFNYQGYSWEERNSYDGVLLIDSTNSFTVFDNYQYIKPTKTLIKYLGNDSDITVPTIDEDGYNIEYIRTNCFRNKRQSLVNVDLSNIALTNGSMEFTFADCENLLNVTNINDNVTNMYYTFYNCQKLETAPIIPSSVTNMGETFYNCTNLTSAPVIPESVTSMYRTFDYCNKLSGDVYILSSEVSNAYSAFGTSYRQNIVNVYIPFTYQNGEYTNTYNSFNSQYGSSQSVRLMDIYGQNVDLTGWGYQLITNGYSNDAMLTSYDGNNIDVVVPHLI